MINNIKEPRNTVTVKMMDTRRPLVTMSSLLKYLGKYHHCPASWLLETMKE